MSLRVSENPTDEVQGVHRSGDVFLFVSGKMGK